MRGERPAVLLASYWHTDDIGKMYFKFNYISSSAQLFSYLKFLYFRLKLPILILSMSTERKTPASDDADLNKKPQNFRFTPETVRKLEKAAREYGMSKTAYTELALKDR